MMKYCFQRGAPVHLTVPAADDRPRLPDLDFAPAEESPERYYEGRRRGGLGDLPLAARYERCAERRLTA